jgi:DNA-binding response OmpR family regulator
MRVLVVDDDRKLGPVLVRGFATDSIAADLVTTRCVREKIDRPFGRKRLQTVRGVGYRICDEG